MVGVGSELFEQMVGRFQIINVIGCEERRQAFLPIIVAAFDFALGLRCGSITEGHAIKVQGGAQLGERIGAVGEEEGVVIDVKHERQAAGLEAAGKKVHVVQQGFAVIEACANIDAGGVIKQV